MKLNQLIETTFLPPIVNRSTGCEDLFEYSLKIEDKGLAFEEQSFVPRFSNKLNGIDYNIQANGERAYSYADGKVFFKLKSEAIKLCWKYFRFNKEHFIPKVEINNAT